jgi:hypothetical protein
VQAELNTATFTLFQSLPTELRLKIFTHTIPAVRVLKISYSPLYRAYIPNIAPPPALSINHESRSIVLATHTYLWLGPKPLGNPLLIPFSPLTDTLYISSLQPLLPSHLPDLLYNLSTSPSRHNILKIAFDLRVWNACCEAGLLGVLARMRGLKEVDIVVEFGRGFKGEVAFLLAPKWRGDLRSLADRASVEVGRERDRVRGIIGMCKEGQGNGREGDVVDVQCVLLTRGGEQA